MNLHYTPYVVPLLGAAAISAAMVLYTWRQRQTPGALASSLLLLAVTEWSVAYALEIAGADLPTKLFWAKMQYLGATTVPALWLIFALQYTRRAKWLTRRNLALLGIVPLITLLLVWTNEAHRLIWNHFDLHQGPFLALHVEHGPGFWLHVLFSYAALLTGSGLIILMLIRSPQLYRWQAGILLIGVLAPWVGNAIYLSGRSRLDLTPFAFTITGMMMILGLFRFRLLDIVPIAHDAVIASMSDGMVVLDKQARIVDMNSAAERILGLLASQAIGQPVAQVLSAQRDLVERYHDVVVAQDEITVGQAETRRHYDLRISPLTDWRGQAMGRVIVLRDITDRKKAEEQLQAAEKRYRAVVEQVPAVVYMDAADETSSTLYISPHVERMLGYTPQEWISDPDLWATLLHSEDRVRVLVEHERANQAGNPSIMEYRMTARDGSVVWVRDEALLIRDKNGEPAYWQGIFYDITARKQSEEQLRLANIAMESAANAIVVTDRQGRIIWVNPAFTQLTGYTPEKTLGQKPSLLKSGRHDTAFYQNLWQTITAGQVWQGELVNRRKDGSLYIEEQIITPVLDERGDISHFIGIKQDITQRKQAEEELRSQKQLFENLVAVARATVERPTLEDTLQNALNVAIALTRAEKGSLFLLDGSGAVTHSILTRSELTAEQRQAILGRVMDKGLAGWVFRNRQAALISDTTQDERWVTLPNDPNVVRSALAVPIISGSAITGILTLTHAQPDHFDAANAKLMQAAADQMALAMRNAQIFDEMRQMADRQITLYETLRSISGQLDPGAVLKEAVSAITDSVGWPNVAVALPNAEYSHLVIHTARGELSPAPGTIIPIDQGIIGRVFTTAVTQRIPDVTTDPDYVALYPGIRSKLVVPIKRGSQTLGVLNLASSRWDGFDSDDVLLAESLADTIALALDNASLFQATQDERGQLQALIKSNRDGIILISLNRYIRVVNQPVLNLLRLPGQPEDWVNRPISDALSDLRHISPSVVKATLAEMRRVQQGSEPPGEGEYEVPPRTIHWLNLPVMSGDTPLGRLLVLHDVTEERAVERLREDMTRTMVHDLRNPLTGIVTSLGLLTQGIMGELSPTQTDVLKIAESSAQRMKEMVNSILDVSRLESGRMPVEYDEFALVSLVAEVFLMQATLAHEKNIRLEKEVPFTLPPAWADQGLISRVLQNLVGNALKFTPAGGVVRVSARVEGKAGHTTLLVAVSDTGPGIPPEIESRVFQKFVTGGQEGRGSGLGLAFCKLALEAHGQRIWAESVPGQGATFTFTLAMHSPLASAQP